MGGDTSVLKKKHERNPMTQEEKEDRKTQKHRKKRWKSIGHQRPVCLGIKGIEDRNAKEQADQIGSVEEYVKREQRNRERQTDRDRDRGRQTVKEREMDRLMGRRWKDFGHTLSR